MVKCRSNHLVREISFQQSTERIQCIIQANTSIWAFDWRTNDRNKNIKGTFWLTEISHDDNRHPKDKNRYFLQQRNVKNLVLRPYLQLKCTRNTNRRKQVFFACLVGLSRIWGVESRLKIIVLQQQFEFEDLYSSQLPVPQVTSLVACWVYWGVHSVGYCCPTTTIWIPRCYWFSRSYLGLLVGKVEGVRSALGWSFQLLQHPSCLLNYLC